MYEIKSYYFNRSESGEKIAFLGEIRELENMASLSVPTKRGVASGETRWKKSFRANFLNLKIGLKSGTGAKTTRDFYVGTYKIEETIERMTIERIGEELQKKKKKRRK